MDDKSIFDLYITKLAHNHAMFGLPDKGLATKELCMIVFLDLLQLRSDPVIVINRSLRYLSVSKTIIIVGEVRVVDFVQRHYPFPPCYHKVLNFLFTYH